MICRSFHRVEAGRAAHLVGRGGHGRACVVDPHPAELDACTTFAGWTGVRITHGSRASAWSSAICAAGGSLRADRGEAS